MQKVESGLTTGRLAHIRKLPRGGEIRRAPSQTALDKLDM